jgi:phosphomannomutase/phosphoglucomutase
MPAPDYLRMLAEKIGALPRRLKVVVDCGTASLFAEDFLSSLGRDVIALYCQSDGRFPNHHPDPVKGANLTEMIERVQADHADLGIAFDGDADRLGAVDDRGRVIWGDQLMAVLTGDPAQTPRSRSHNRGEMLPGPGGRSRGGKPYFYRTGHSLGKAKMRELGRSGSNCVRPYSS